MFKDKIRKCDIEAIVKFTIAWPIALFMRYKHKDLWLVSERSGEARDNGYWMYKYIREKHPEQDAWYLIKKDSLDKKRIEAYGNLIDYGSFKHYIYFLMVSKRLSAHIDVDTPNSRVSNFLENHGIIKNKKIFLQHGITKDKISFGYYSVSRADLFVCAAKPEYEFCKKEFGYPEGAVQLLGFARFDGLGIVPAKKQILLMPTWRAWLARVSETDFKESRYFQTYQSLINNDDLIRCLEENGFELIFYPHSDMQKFASLFETRSPNISIAESKQYDVQRLLNESECLITDYSSVAFDMAYMGKPVVYYQFDYDEYRKGQHPEGYYYYQKDGFGPVVTSESEIVEWIKNLNKNDLKPSEEYSSRIDRFFTLRDRENCKRIFEACRRL